MTQIEHYLPRKVQRINSSLWVSLPKEWTRIHKLKRGDTLRAILAADGYNLVLSPEVSK